MCMAQKITTTLSDEFHALAKNFNLNWAEALRIGLAILLMERGESGFANPINKVRIKSLARKVGLVVV